MYDCQPRICQSCDSEGIWCEPGDDGPHPYTDVVYTLPALTNATALINHHKSLSMSSLLAVLPVFNTHPVLLYPLSFNASHVQRHLAEKGNFL